MNIYKEISLLSEMVKKETHEHSKSQLEEHILHNLIELQKIHVNIAEKFDKLTSQVSQLLSLFELSARAFAKQTNLPGMERDREFLDKIDKLLEQNKTIAKGLTLVEEKMRERIFGQVPSQPQTRPNEMPRQLPRFQA